MEHDEHEMLIEYSEMTSFNFDSKEFQEAKKDYIECRNWVESIVWRIRNFKYSFKAVKNY